MSNYPDSSPNAKAKGEGGMKNHDGREGGHDGPKMPEFKDKAVGDMPNEGAPELSKKGVIAEKR